ncbi:MAG TPA: O-antigen ligase family protein [Thermoanaerobaculia bacterium]
MRTVAETAAFVCLLAFLAWVPMPFGSASDAAQPFLIVPPLLICAAAALLRASSKRPFLPTKAARIWITGAVLFAIVIALQLVPLPMAMLRVLSPRSAAIWGSAARVAALAGVHAPAMHPITIDPDQTALHLYRVLAYAATFLASLILVRDKRRRMMFAALLAAVAIFEAFYAVREAALGRYAIWGWKNTLIYGRATGTFVNPNHFGHYAAILLPMALYLSAAAWHGAAPAGALFGRRLVRMMERQFLPFAGGLVAALACITAVLVSESRGAMLAIIGGFAIVGAIASDPRRALLRGALIALAAAAVVAAVVVVLGQSRMVRRLEGSRVSELESRRASAAGALRIWQLFPLFGSGAGTYEDAVVMTRSYPGEAIPNHAHDDYAEILGTTGALGFLVSVVPLFAGFAVLSRNAFGKNGEPMSWRRRAFKAAALTSIAIAMLHALVDFNFFIPANPITLAAIAGAAVVARES